MCERALKGIVAKRLTYTDSYLRESGTMATKAEAKAQSKNRKF